MKTYYIKIVETRSQIVEVHADSLDEAVDKAENANSSIFMMDKVMNSALAVMAQCVLGRSKSSTGWIQTVFTMKKQKWAMLKWSTVLL